MDKPHCLKFILLFNIYETTLQILHATNKNRSW